MIVNINMFEHSKTNIYENDNLTIGQYIITDTTESNYLEISFRNLKILFCTSIMIGK